MCSVCKDDQCHWGEYCYPSGKSTRPLDRTEQKVMQDALRKSVKIIGRGKDLRKPTV